MTITFTSHDSQLSKTVDRSLYTNESFCETVLTSVDKIVIFFDKNPIFLFKSDFFYLNRFLKFFFDFLLHFYTIVCYLW